MSRIPKDSDFTVDVEGVGRFTFARRTMRDELAIQREYSDILQGVIPTDWLATVGGWMSTLRVLTVHAPTDWVLDDLDPTDTATYEKMVRVHSALVEKERSFRCGSEPAGQGSGQTQG